VVAGIANEEIPFLGELVHLPESHIGQVLEHSLPGRIIGLPGSLDIEIATVATGIDGDVEDVLNGVGLSLLFGVHVGRKSGRRKLEPDAPGDLPPSIDQVREVLLLFGGELLEPPAYERPIAPAGQLEKHVAGVGLRSNGDSQRFE
jgi:hypothetical protein